MVVYKGIGCVDGLEFKAGDNVDLTVRFGLGCGL